MLKQYETVFIVNPVLSEQQMKDTVEKFKKILQTHEAELVHEEFMGLRKLAYTIQKKTTGYYHLLEFKAKPEVIATLELEYRREDTIMRYLTTVLDKFAIEYNEKKRKGLVGKKSDSKK